MSEQEAISLSREGPVTIETLRKDLTDLGIEPGMTIIVHSSLSALGWVCGGAEAVIEALERTIRPYGTLVMPTHSGHLSDPAGWEHPAVPESWWEPIRRSMPSYDPEKTPTRGVGVIPELFRTFEDVVRSNHPQLSFAAWGEGSLDVTTGHTLDFSLGESSPLGRVYERDGWILLLGVGYEGNTSLHLAEATATYAKKKEIENSAPVTIDGHRRWKRFRDWEYSMEDFAEIGRDFEDSWAREIRIGMTGYAEARLIRQRPLVDFARNWMHRKRR